MSEATISARRLSDKVAIVGAGARPEITRALIAALETQGATVVEAAANADWPQLVADTVAAHGGLDILVNGPGPYLASALDETSAEMFDSLFADTVESAFCAIQAAMPAMAQRGGGSIINIGSRLGVRGMAGATAYSAVQGALTQMTLSAALDGAKRKIRVNVIHAGSEDVERHGDGLLPSPDGAGLAGAVTYLASDEARLVTGSEMTVDGGMNAL